MTDLRYCCSYYFKEYKIRFFIDQSDILWFPVLEMSQPLGFVENSLVWEIQMGSKNNLTGCWIKTIPTGQTKPALFINKHGIEKLSAKYLHPQYLAFMEWLKKTIEESRQIQAAISGISHGLTRTNTDSVPSVSSVAKQGV